MFSSTRNGHFRKKCDWDCVASGVHEWRMRRGVKNWRFQKIFIAICGGRAKFHTRGFFWPSFGTLIFRECLVYLFKFRIRCFFLSLVFIAICGGRAVYGRVLRCSFGPFFAGCLVCFAKFVSVDHCARSKFLADFCGMSRLFWWIPFFSDRSFLAFGRLVFS